MNNHSLRKITTLFAYTVITAASAGAIASDLGKISTEKYIVDEAGRKSYIILIGAYEPSEKALKKVAPTIKVSELTEEDDPDSWHKPEARYLLKEFNKKYQTQAKIVTSWSAIQFKAYLTDEQFKLLKQDPIIEDIVAEEKIDDELSAWGDTIENGEIIPWGKKASGANDTITTNNPVYILDAGNTPHNELNITALPTIPGNENLYTPKHGNHVAGIIGQARDNNGARGINPGAPIISVMKGKGPTETMAAMDQILADAEQKNIFAIVNLSSNATRMYNYSQNTGNFVGPMIRSMSTRLLVVQSAGNVGGDACIYAYAVEGGSISSPYKEPLAGDGIIVVGGADENGEQAQFDNSHVGFDGTKSNYGKCVEVWAPSTRIWSAWSPGNTSQYLSGTSMAAPHVSALAARYGDSQTTPVQREFYIRSKLTPTGKTAADGAPIKRHSYLATPSFSVPNKLIPTDISTSGGFGDVHTLFDGKYLSGDFWNAGAQTGWVQFDLGSIKTIRSVRMTPNKSGRGESIHEFYVGNTPSSMTLSNTINDLSDNMEPISSTFTATGRYLKIKTVFNSASWTSWREIEIYGN